MSEVINGILKSEKIWVIIFNRNKTYYITTKDNSREFYFLYEIKNDKAVKIAKCNNPIELENKYIYNQK